MKYEAIEVMTHEEANRVFESGDARATCNAIISLALNDTDSDRTAKVCLRFASHDDAYVRGAALTGLGHLARRFRAFSDVTSVTNAVKAGLADSDARVRGHADDAADELEQFANAKVR